MSRCFDFELCEGGYVVYQDGQRLTAIDLVLMLNGNGQADNQMPEWVQHFFIHIVKRSAKMLIAWIDDLQEAKIIDREGKDSHIRLKKLP